MSAKEPKIKKTKVPKQPKEKTEKQLAKEEKKASKKRRFNFKNYKSTNSMIILMIFIFRIVMTAFLFTYPLIFALTSVYDRGTKDLMLYTAEIAPKGMTSFFSFGSSVSGIESMTRAVPYMLWLIWGFITLFVFFLPFFTSKTKGSKGFLSFYYMLIGGIGFGIIYALRYEIISIMPHDSYDMSNWNEVDAKSRYWADLNEYFSEKSFWMILNQIYFGITIVFGVWEAIESDLIRRGKLSYSDLITNVNKANSLANKVLNGQLEFGNVPDENLHLSITKLKAKLNIEAAMTAEELGKSYETEDSRQTEIEKERQNIQKPELENEIKEGV